MRNRPPRMHYKFRVAYTPLMEFQLIPDPGAFREVTRELLADEASNNLILGVLSSAIGNPQAYDDCRAMVVVDGGDVAAGGLVTTPPQNLIVAAGESGEHLSTLAEGVLAAGVEIHGAIGVRPVVDGFADRWTERTGTTSRLSMAQGIYALDTVTPPPPVRGGALPAVAGDADIVTGWMRAFAAEALPDEPSDQARLRAMVTRRLEGGGPTGTWLWEVDGSPVSMSSHSGPTGKGIRINAVYTLAEHRSNGYASALVATQSQFLLDDGYEACFLFTDLANPTSNRIYESIGYHRIAESALFLFDPP